ncbi:MAG: hypothetical protein Q9228_007947, partial [Teloschistes exilis]
QTSMQGAASTLPSVPENPSTEVVSGSTDSTTLSGSDTREILDALQASNSSANERLDRLTTLLEGLVELQRTSLQLVSGTRDPPPHLAGRRRESPRESPLTEPPPSVQGSRPPLAESRQPYLEGEGSGIGEDRAPPFPDPGFQLGSRRRRNGTRDPDQDSTVPNDYSRVKVPEPSYFEGDKDKLKAFITQVRMYIEFKPEAFRNDQDK